MLTWAAWIGVNLARMATAVHGAIPTWLGGDAFVMLALDFVRAATMLICWVGSVYAWSRVGVSGVLHGAALVMLIFLGAVAGPFYILITAGRWSRHPERARLPAP